jgi:hypothetical protein
MTTEAAAIVTAQTEQQAQAAEQQSADDTALTAAVETTEGETADGETPPADKADGDNADGNDTKDSSLEAYADFTLPEGMTLNDGLLEQAAPLFKELGLNQEQAQKLVDFQAAQVEAGQQGQMDAFNQLKNDWVDQAKKDPEIGGDKFDETIGIAKEAMTKFGSEGLTKLLNDFGMGNHPEMIRFMANVGKLTKEDSPGETGNPVGKPRDHVGVLYPEKS